MIKLYSSKRSYNDIGQVNIQLQYKAARKKKKINTLKIPQWSRKHFLKETFLVLTKTYLHLEDF